MIKISRTICFIEKNTGMSSVCDLEGLSEKEIVELIGSSVIDCTKCPTYKDYKGKEKAMFLYTKWTGELKEDKNIICPICGKEPEPIIINTTPLLLAEYTTYREIANELGICIRCAMDKEVIASKGYKEGFSVGYLRALSEIELSANDRLNEVLHHIDRIKNKKVDE